MAHFLFKKFFIPRKKRLVSASANKSSHGSRQTSQSSSSSTSLECSKEEFNADSQQSSVTENPLFELEDDNELPGCPVSFDIKPVFQLDREGEESESPRRSPLAVLLAASDTLSYSGSVSLRSNGSTTSSHSFSFPILNSEWTGSPERMANADQTQQQKQRCWSSRLLCFKF